MRIGSDAQMLDVMKRLAIRAVGAKHYAVSRGGTRLMDSQAAREIANLPLPADYQQLQNRDGTMNR